MRRFDQQGLLDRQLESGTLSEADIRDLGAHIAARHLEAPVIESSQRDRLIGLTKQFIRDNFTALAGVIDDAELKHFSDWTEQELQNLETRLAQRFDAGFVRECHGDLHLANLVRLPGGITAFDCIEFNADLRHTDVFGDIAFLVMDLVARRRHDLAAHFLNRYLERTGDYDGMSVFSLYFVYRCLVRAKVAAIRCQERVDTNEVAADRDEVLFYCDMARRQILPRVPILVVMSGFSGSGKTWVSTKLLAAMPAIRVRSDIERKRIFGLHETEDSGSGVGEGIYTAQAGRKVYERLFSVARTNLAAGHNVILDAAFLGSAEREAAVDIARRYGGVPVILPVSAPVEVMRQRLLIRTDRADDASEAGLAVFEHQLANAEPVSDQERALVIPVDNSAKVDVAAIAAEIKGKAKKEITD
jgi:predicted kinase